MAKLPKHFRVNDDIRADHRSGFHERQPHPDCPICTTHHRGYELRTAADGNFYCPSLDGTAKAATLATLKRWIDLAIASGELKQK